MLTRTLILVVVMGSHWHACMHEEGLYILRYLLCSFAYRRYRVICVTHSGSRGDVAWLPGTLPTYLRRSCSYRS